MKYIALLILCCWHGLLHAEPAIDAELVKQVPSQEISNLIAMAEELFAKRIESLEFIYTDEPPVGDSAVIVRFSREPESSNIYIFPAAFFYYLPWSKDKPLAPAKKKVVRGNWATDGELQNTRKYRFELSSGIIYISFSTEITYGDAMSLLKAIDLGDYDVNFDTGSELWDDWLRSADQDLFQRLQVSTIFYLDINNDNGERRFILSVNNPKGGLSQWTFAKRNSKYVLLAMSPYAI